MFGPYDVTWGEWGVIMIVAIGALVLAGILAVILDKRRN